MSQLQAPADRPDELDNTHIEPERHTFTSEEEATLSRIHETPAESDFLRELDGYGAYSARAKIDHGMVDSLMACVSSSVFRPADKVRELADWKDKPWMRNGGVFRNPQTFLPPEELQSRNDITLATRKLWEGFADEILYQALMDGVLTAWDLEQLNKGKGQHVTSIFHSHAIGSLDSHAYFSVDTRPSVERGVEGVEDDVEKTVNAIKAKLRCGVVRVLQDPVRVKQIVDALRIERGINARIQLRPEIARLNRIRERVESPEERAMFLDLMQQAVRVLGFSREELEVELLSSTDALVFTDVIALYKSELKDKNGEVIRKAKIAIPMSHYGTTQLRTLEEVFEILAHEVVHHQQERFSYMKMAAVQRGPHSLTQETMTHVNLQRLRQCKVDFEFNDDGSVARMKLIPPNERFLDTEVTEGDVALYQELLDESFKVLEAELGITNDWGMRICNDNNVLCIGYERDGKFRPSRSVDNSGYKRFWEQLASLISHLTVWIAGRDKQTGDFEPSDELKAKFPNDAKSCDAMMHILEQRVMGRLERASVDFRRDENRKIAGIQMAPGRILDEGESQTTGADVSQEYVLPDLPNRGDDSGEVLPAQALATNLRELRKLVAQAKSQADDFINSVDRSETAAGRAEAAAGRAEAAASRAEAASVPAKPVQAIVRRTSQGKTVSSSRPPKKGIFDILASLLKKK